MFCIVIYQKIFLLFQYDNDGDIEYEFPTYIIREKDETLWKPWGKNVDCCYGGIRLSPQPHFLELLTSIFIRIQVLKSDRFVVIGSNHSNIFVRWNYVTYKTIIMKTWTVTYINGTAVLYYV